MATNEPHRTVIPGLDFVSERPRPVSLDDLACAMRWCFSDGELKLAMADRGSVEAWNILADVTYRPQIVGPKYRYAVHAIFGESGWLQVKALRISAKADWWYMLSAAFTDAGQRVRFDALERLFDHVDSWASLSSVPECAIQRLQGIIDVHCRVSIAHWREAQEEALKGQDSSQSISRTLASLQLRLKGIRHSLSQSRSSEELTALKSEQAHCRRQIIEVEAQEAELLRKLIATTPPLRGKTYTTTLFTQRWHVLPLSSPTSSGKLTR